MSTQPRCDEVREWLSARYDGEELDDNHAMVTHSASCLSCAAFAAALPSITRLTALRLESDRRDVPAIAAMLDAAGAPPVDRRRQRAQRSRKGVLGLAIPALALAFAVPAAASGGPFHEIVTPTKAPTPCTRGLHPGAVGLVLPSPHQQRNHGAR